MEGARVMKKIIALFVILLFMMGCAQHNELEADEPLDLTQLADTDRDGVIDARDACPGTKTDLMVTNNGCPIEENVEQVEELVVFFEVSSSQLKASDIKKLESKVKYIKEHEGTSILLEGYTSNIGSKDDNHRLQEERALSVQSALVSLGAKPETIIIHHQGNLSEHLQVDEKHMHNANQRVYIKIIKLSVKSKNKWSFMTNE